MTNLQQKIYGKIYQGMFTNFTSLRSNVLNAVCHLSESLYYRYPIHVTFFIRHSISLIKELETLYD